MVLKPRVTLTDLEIRVTHLEKHVTDIQSDVLTIKQNTDLIVDVMTATKTVGGFLHKHGPRLIAFGTGIATAAGVGNPAIWKFISTFVW